MSDLASACALSLSGMTRPGNRYVSASSIAANPVVSGLAVQGERSESRNAVQLSMSRAKIYDLIRSGTLASVRIDGSRRIRAKDLEAYVASLDQVA